MKLAVEACLCDTIHCAVTLAAAQAARRVMSIYRLRLVFVKCTHMSDVTANWAKLAPNGTNMGHLKISFR